MKFVTFSKLGSYGRFGNQLFQISTCIAMAMKYKCNVAFSQIPSEVLEMFPNLKRLVYPYVLERPIKIIKESGFEYNKSFMEAEYTPEFEGAYDLEGYFQSEKYFSQNKSILEWAFSFQRYVLCDRLSIHIRLGDYQKYSDTYVQLLDTDYYQRCIYDVKTKNPHIKYVCIFTDASDNIYKDKRFKDLVGVLESNNLVYKVFTKESIPATQVFSLMAMSSYIICANSSFSWWASYMHNFNDKLVYMPKEWFNPKCGLSSNDLYRTDVNII